MTGSAFRKFAYLAPAVLVLVAGLIVGTAAPSFATCIQDTYRAKDFYNHTNAIGITGQLTTPSSGLIGGIGTNMPSAGDISLDNYTTGYMIQIGWYLGQAENLPNTTVPRIFFGQTDPSSPSGEDLMAGSTLSWSTSYSFKLLATTTGGYHASMNGGYLFSNTVAQGSLPTPQMNGEVENSCTTMYSIAVRNPAPPWSTLYEATGSASSPTWSVFVDSYVTIGSGVVAEPYEGGTTGNFVGFN